MANVNGKTPRFELLLVPMALVGVAACGLSTPNDGQGDGVDQLRDGKLQPLALVPIDLEPIPLDPSEGGEDDGGDDGGGEPQAPVCGAEPVSVAPQAALCPNTRWVGDFGGLPCPSPYGEDPVPVGDHWEVEALTGPPGSPVVNYCRYLWEGSLEPTDLPVDIANVVGPDCRVFAQSPLAHDMAPHYEQAFAEAAQPVEADLLPIGASVAIMVIDTAPAFTSKGDAAHGPAMAAIAAKLAAGCVEGFGEATCDRTVKTHLGLPQTVAGVDRESGGYYGYQSDLAEGIMAAIADWPDPNHGDQKLVVNLSVGWEPTPDEDLDPAPAVVAVRETIELARCRGALVVAASGNRPQGTCIGEATGPGAWAAQLGPDGPRCNALGVVTPVLGASPSPLLHAATPLDWFGDNLADFRSSSNSALAAVGYAGFDTRGNHNFGPLTGSSVSTAVVSGVAALVWSYYSELDADQVMNLIYASGEPTGMSVDLGLPNQIGAQQNQVSACGALRQACQVEPSDACAALAGCPAPGPVAVDVLAWSAAYDQNLANLDPGQLGAEEGPAWTAVDCVGCEETPKFVKLEVDAPSEPAVTWVLPQPQKSPCPFCKIKADAIDLSLDPDYESFPLLDMTVWIYDATGASEVLYYRGPSLPPLSSTTVQTVTDAELLDVNTGTAAAGGTGLPPVSAYVEMHFDDGGRGIVAGNQVFVD